MLFARREVRVGRGGGNPSLSQFYPELSQLNPKMYPNSSVSDRVVNQLLTELDGLESRKDVYIIGATNRLELIDGAMLRPGRLGKLLYVPLPSEADRVSILQALTRRVSIDVSVSVEEFGRDSHTEGFSGADLSALVREAGLAVSHPLLELMHRRPPYLIINGSITPVFPIGREGVETKRDGDRVCTYDMQAALRVGSNKGAAFCDCR